MPKPQSPELQPRSEFSQRIDEIGAKLKARNQQTEGRIFVALGEGNSQFSLFDSPIPVGEDGKLSEYLLLTSEGFVTVRCMSANSPEVDEENTPVFADIVHGIRGREKPWVENKPVFITLPDGSTDLRLTDRTFHFDPEGNIDGFPSDIHLNRLPSEDSVTRIITANIERAEKEKLKEKLEAESQSAVKAGVEGAEADKLKKNVERTQEIRSAQLPLIAKVDSLL